ncbi:MAG: hypothetical protein H6977_08760 [Gammaproteobacteria bacterium]|nr:hypothetical protein [Gammaproteobacteria bacterium]MCP5200092.1 hypothetical protein [Gammaproteobacteria bacterium]
MIAHVIDVDWDHIVVSDAGSTRLLKAINEHSTCVGDELAGDVSRGVGTFRNLSRNAMLVAFVEAAGDAREHR